MRRITSAGKARSAALARYAGVQDDIREAPKDAELDRDFDLTWARSSPTHELSAHGRSVQRRLDTPPAKPSSPSVWKRLRFALYRWRTGC